MALRACCDDFIPTFVDKVTFTQLPDVHLANAKASHLLSTLDHTHTLFLCAPIKGLPQFP